MVDNAAKSTGTKDNGWQRWNDELQYSVKVRGYETWQTRAKKIVKRYRDERTDATDYTDSAETVSGVKFNILWSNVQTLMPALFAKTPKPVVERRYLDRDAVGRTASVILERALLYQLDEGQYQSALRKAVLDRLLPGRGVIWVRYEPRFVRIPSKTQEATDGVEVAEKPSQAEGYTKDGDVEEQVADESCAVDYVDWMDFRTSPARVWEEVTWVAKRVYMSRSELEKRFTTKHDGKSIGSQVTLDWTPLSNKKTASGTAMVDGEEYQKRAKVWEIWDKISRCVYWIAESWGDAILDKKEDPLQLEGFWPCPKPLFATLTNESLVPVPDFYEYQDQAMELDDLTSRIAALTKVIKACGIYDASIPELQRMFEEGFENKLVPADNMTEFLQKAGPNGMGAIWMLPIRDMVFALGELYKARAEVKQTLYEITGISDIVRGQSTAGTATATEQRIKGQFASMRLNDMQAEVARFARDTLRIMGEIIAEQFDPMTLFLISGYEQYAKEQFPPEPAPAQPGIGHNGGPTLDQPLPGPGAAGGVQSLPNAPGVQPPDPEQIAQAKAADMFKKAVELLRNDKLRGFRIDIETDSLVEADQQQMQQSRTELLGAISQFLPQAIEAGIQAPELKPLMARLLMFFLRGFKASRDIESAFEQFIDDVTKDAANPKPKPPSPEEIKAKAEIQKQEMEGQRMQMQAQIDQQKAASDIQLQQQKAQIEIEKAQMQLEIERQKLALEREKMAMEQQKAAMGLQVEQQKAEIQGAAAERDAQIDERSALRQDEMAERADERDAEAGERDAELAEKVAKAKAQQAMKPKGDRK